MPNEPISCASTGYSSQSSSTRKDRRPLKIRATLLFERGGHDDANGTPGDSAGYVDAIAVPGPAQRRIPEGRTVHGFDATFSMRIKQSGSAITDSAGLPHTGLGDGIERGLIALYRNILSVNAPDRLFDLIVIEAAETGTGGPLVSRAAQSLLDTQSLRLRQLLEVAGYTVQKLEIRSAESPERAPAPVFA